MSHAEVFTLLDDYVGGELPVSERETVRRHLAECGECRAEEASLRALLDQTRFLPREVAPARDLWTDIAPRLEPRFRDELAERRKPAIRLPRWMATAAAAVALMAGSSAVTAYFVGGRSTPEVAQLPPAVVRETSAPTVLASFTPAEAEYQRAIGELTAVLEARRSQLAPETVATIEVNLRVIDEAIRQSRAALEADPNSPELAEMLSAVYDTKVQMLHRVVQL